MSHGIKGAFNKHHTPVKHLWRRDPQSGLSTSGIGLERRASGCLRSIPTLYGNKAIRRFVGKDGIAVCIDAELALKAVALQSVLRNPPAFLQERTKRRFFRRLPRPLGPKRTSLPILTLQRVILPPPLVCRRNILTKRPDCFSHRHLLVPGQEVDHRSPGILI